MSTVIYPTHPQSAPAYTSSYIHTTTSYKLYYFIQIKEILKNQVVIAANSLCQNSFFSSTLVFICPVFKNLITPCGNVTYSLDQMRHARREVTIMTAIITV